MEEALRPEVAEKFKLVKAKATSKFANAAIGTFRLCDLTLPQAEKLVAEGFEYLRPVKQETTEK